MTAPPPDQPDPIPALQKPITLTVGSVGAAMVGIGIGLYLVRLPLAAASGSELPIMVSMLVLLAGILCSLVGLANPNGRSVGLLGAIVGIAFVAFSLAEHI
jgi:hypothetical protein